MVITLTPQLEAVLSEQARRRGVASEVLAPDALRKHFLRIRPLGAARRMGAAFAWNGDGLRRIPNQRATES